MDKRERSRMEWEAQLYNAQGPRKGFKDFEVPSRFFASPSRKAVIFAWIMLGAAALVAVVEIARPLFR